jgi:hypothetical protein
MVPIQNWDYRNESHLLNFLMYFFMNVGFTLWAIGLKREKFTDILLILMVMLTPVAYYMNIKPIIWTAQLICVVILTIRGKQITQDSSGKINQNNQSKIESKVFFLNFLKRLENK